MICARLQRSDFAVVAIHLLKYVPNGGIVCVVSLSLNPGFLLVELAGFLQEVDEIADILGHYDFHDLVFDLELAFEHL